MGGLASLCGSPGRPPIRPSAAQGYAQACAQAVVGTMIAHYHRTRTGRGQRVDQSMQEAVTFTHDNAIADLGYPRDQHRAARQRTQYRRLSERPVRLRSCRRARRSALLWRALRPDRSPDRRVARPPRHGRRPHLRGVAGQARRHAGRPAATRRPRRRPSQRRARALLQALQSRPARLGGAADPQRLGHRPHARPTCWRTNISPPASTGSRSNTKTSASALRIPDRGPNSQRRHSPSEAARRTSANTTARSTATCWASPTTKSNNSLRMA